MAARMQRSFQNPVDIYDGAFYENSLDGSVVHYLRKKLHLKYSAGFWIRLWSKQGFPGSNIALVIRYLKQIGLFSFFQLIFC